MTEFYLGRLFDPKSAKLTDKDLNYDLADLTTHAVVTGMTGSGKTGLCISLLEEAALNGVPAIIIDPKGDLTNLLLHFPELLPQDFQPWIDPEVVRRANKTPEQASQEAALAWRNGLAEWGMTPERILDLKNSAQFSIFTPGSDFRHTRLCTFLTRRPRDRLGREPRSPARTHHQHRHRLARAGRHERPRPHSITRAYFALQHL